MGNNIGECKSIDNGLTDKDFTDDEIMDTDKTLREKT